MKNDKFYIGKIIPIGLIGSTSLIFFSNLELGESRVYLYLILCTIALIWGVKIGSKLGRAVSFLSRFFLGLMIYFIMTTVYLVYESFVGNYMGQITGSQIAFMLGGVICIGTVLALIIAFMVKDESKNR